jgi:hypothetical protein
MASQIQYRRGTNAQNAAFTGALAEITVDTTNGTLRVHDAITAGGSNIATVAYVTSQISSLSSNSISFGTSSVAVIASGGNIRSNVDGTTVQTISAGLVAITGDLSVTGNATLSGNILGDRIQNGTTSIDIQTPSGNANISIGGTSNVAVFTTTGVVVTGAISATGTVTAASTVGGVITGTSASVSGTVTAASTVGGVITGSSVSVSGTVTAASTVGGVLSGSSLTVSTGSITCGSIVNANANAVGNIGSSSLYFNTVFAKATSAQYADLAEMYVADAEYAPGTVVEFGGTAEVTQSTASHSTRVAGIVSTNPSYLMNATLTGDHVVPVALTGRVPCQVTGTIAKGDRLVAGDIPGVATRLDPNKYEPACIIGKALETYDSETTGIIEVAVGRT